MNTIALLITVLLVNQLYSATLFYNYTPDAIEASDALGNPISIQNQTGIGYISYDETSSGIGLTDITDFSFSAYITSINELGNLVEVEIVYDLSNLTSIEIDESGSIVDLRATKDFIFIPPFSSTSRSVTFNIEPDYSASLLTEDHDQPSALAAPSHGVVTIIPEPSSSSILTLFTVIGLLQRTRNKKAEQVAASDP